MRRPWKSGAAIAVTLACWLISPASTWADETSTHPATSYQIDGIIEITKGPYKPGDPIAFDIKTSLPRQDFHYFQVSGECFVAPAEWHIGSENLFLDNQFVRKGYALSIISSGCTDGLHQVTEVELEDKDQGFARITINENQPIHTFSTVGGQLRIGSDNSARKSDSINNKTLPLSVRMKSKSPYKFWTLSRLTSQKQTISWAVNGKCSLKRNLGAADIGGDIFATAPGKCYIAANTPWGSNLFNPVNMAWEIRIYSSDALLCVDRKTKKQIFADKSKCPMGYLKR